MTQVIITKFEPHSQFTELKGKNITVDFARAHTSMVDALNAAVSWDLLHAFMFERVIDAYHPSEPHAKAAIRIAAFAAAAAIVTTAKTPGVAYSLGALGRYQATDPTHEGGCQVFKTIGDKKTAFAPEIEVADGVHERIAVEILIQCMPT